MALAGTTFLAPALPVTLSVAQPLGRTERVAAASFSTGVVGAVSLGAVAGALAAVSGRQRTRVARRFFNLGPPPAPKRVPGPLALPMLPEPAFRELNDVLMKEADAGFDPLALATAQSQWGTGEDSYYNYREAEVKHGRLAMLATVGWLTSEELQGAIARQLGLKDDLAPGELAPSLVNGGLGNLPNWFLPAVFLVSAWIELVPRQQGNRADVLKYEPKRGRVPGDLAFDPLGLKDNLAGQGYSLARLHNAEVKHGRAAMIAITAFVVQEFVTKVPVIQEDEITADRAVLTLDRGIDAIDKAAGLKIPDVPVPFPGLS